VGGAEEEGVRAPDQLDILGREGAAVSYVAGLVKVPGDQDPRLDVLGAVPVGLLDLDDQPPLSALNQGPVHTDAPTADKLHHDQPDLLTRRQPVQRVAGGKHGADLERGQRRDVEEAGGSGQRRDPQLASAVPPGQSREGPVCQESGDAAVQLDRFEHPCKAGRLILHPSAVLDGQLAGVEARVGKPMPLRHDLLHSAACGGTKGQRLCIWASAFGLPGVS
jgi:hypothetical protein